MMILVDTHNSKEHLYKLFQSLRDMPTMKITNDKVVVEMSTETYAVLCALAYSFYSGSLTVELKA